MFKQKIFHHLFLVFFLLAAGKSYAASENPRQTLTNAINNGDLLQVQSIIESKKVGIEEVPEKDSKGISPLVEAASNGQFAIIKYLIEKGASVDGPSRTNDTPLMKLIQEGSSKLTCQQLLEITRYLIDSGAKVNRSGEKSYTPLMNACKYTRCLELMEMLMDLGAAINTQASDGNNAFFLSIRNTNIPAFYLLLKRGAKTSLNCKGLSPLGVAAVEGNIIMARLIIDELKADVNEYDEIGGTAVIWSALFEQTSMISFLVEKGADINAKTPCAISVEKPFTDNSWRIPSLSTTYIVFPKNSTPLTFAKWFSSISSSKSMSAVNYIRDIGGIEFQHAELKEETKSWFR